MARNSTPTIWTTLSHFATQTRNLIRIAPSRYPYDDPAAQKQFEYLRSFLGEATAGPITAVPWLKFVPPFKGIYWNIRHSMEGFRIFIKDVIKEQK